jgi:CPA2 family monovalent cation:H+ antiporter-2
MSAVDIDSAMDYAEHAPLRRGGGGGGAPIVVPLGFMLIVLAVFAVPMYKLRQPNLMVALIIGVIAGGTGLAPSLKPFELDYSIKALEIPLVDALVEMGIMLLLFFAGLSIDAGPELLKKYYRLILVMGLGQIAFSWGIYSLIAWASGLCATGPSITYFGLVCTLSSGLLMHNAMDDGMNGTLHGKIMRGILLIQDVTITIALVILPAFVARPGLKLGAGRRAETVEPGATAAPSYASDDYAPVDSGAEVGRLIGIFIGFLVVLSIVTYFILGRMMRFFSLSNEMLFIGVFSYVVGIAGICTYLGFSWAVGAFLAGVSLTFTSMRLEIESKLFSMRTFGMVVNAFLLGVQVPATQDIASKVWGWALLMAFTRVFLQWIILGFFGKLAGVKARTAFFVSNCMNQVSNCFPFHPSPPLLPS